MKVNYNILGILFLSLIFILLNNKFGLINKFFNMINKNNNIEGLTSFSECRAKGYTKEFCLQTPTLYWGPQSCMCEDGSIGVVHPGFRGECLCSRYY
jgi:hypothetical protein